jgi:hypothetical protein
MMSVACWRLAEHHRHLEADVVVCHRPDLVPRRPWRFVPTHHWIPVWHASRWFSVISIVATAVVALCFQCPGIVRG